MERKQDLEAQREAKRAKAVQGKSASNLLRAGKARTKRSRVRAAAEGGDAGSKAKLKAEAQRKSAARKAEAVLTAAEAAKQQMGFDAWCELGQDGGGDVGGRQYSKAQCYAKALQDNDQDGTTRGFVWDFVVVAWLVDNNTLRNIVTRRHCRFIPGIVQRGSTWGFVVVVW